VARPAGLEPATLCLDGILCRWVLGGTHLQVIGNSMFKARPDSSIQPHLSGYPLQYPLQSSCR
jgi:hypothetical protein